MRKENRALLSGGAKGTRPRLRTRPGRGSDSPLGCHSLPRPFESPVAAAKREEHAVQTNRALLVGGAKGTRPRLRTRPGRGSGSPPGCHSPPRPFEPLPGQPLSPWEERARTRRSKSLVELRGLEPLTSTLPVLRTSQLYYSPKARLSLAYLSAPVKGREGGGPSRAAGIDLGGVFRYNKKRSLEESAFPCTRLREKGDRPCGT